MFWTAVKAVQSLLEKPVFIILEGGISGWRTNDGCFILGQSCIAESVLAVALLKYSAVANSFRHQKLQGVVFEHWCISLGLGIHLIFVVAEDYDSGLGPIGFTISISFDNQDTHGWNSFG